MVVLPRILVIDDDADFTESVRTLLVAAGYEVHTAASGREGMALLPTVNPDLIVCDIMMETTTEGYAVSGAVKFQEMTGQASIPLIMVSSIESSPDELFPRSEEIGAIRPDFYLTKPLDIPRFLEVVKKTIARRVHA